MHPWLNWIEYLTTNQAVAGSNPAGCMSGVSKGLAHFNDKGEVLREVAQLGRVLGLGPRGRRFESCLPDYSPLLIVVKRYRLIVNIVG